MLPPEPRKGLMLQRQNRWVLLLRNWASPRTEGGENPQVTAASGARDQLKSPSFPFTLQQPSRLCLLPPRWPSRLCTCPSSWRGRPVRKGNNATAQQRSPMHNVPGSTGKQPATQLSFPAAPLDCGAGSQPPPRGWVSPAAAVHAPRDGVHTPRAGGSQESA